MNFRKFEVGRLGIVASVVLIAAGIGPKTGAQSSSSTVSGIDGNPAAGAAVPALVRYSGEAKPEAGKRVALRFAVYESATGTSPLWSESQNVAVGADGKFSVLLGAASSIGLPPSLFAGGETRWLSIAVGDEPEFERAMLVSVPYAMRAGDAETLAGHPVAELVTQEQLRGAIAAHLSAQELAARQVFPATTTPTTLTGSGSTNYVPLWTGASTLGTSILAQSGTGAAAKIGIGTAAPATTLDVYGGFTVRGDMVVQPATLATASAGVNSPPFFFNASAYSSSLASSVAQKFVFITEVTGNNTASPSSNLQLWYGAGTSAPSATGLSIAPTGIITFASGQTFPGVSTSGGTINATTYDLGGTRFDYGNQSNAFLAFAGNGNQGTGASNLGVGTSSLNSLTSGASNVATGFASLTNTTSGSSNTAVGVQALEFNTTGSSNTGVGGAALVHNYTGSNNTALGQAAGPDSSSTALSGSTAIGANATVSASNALVLGQTTAGSPGATHVNVGIGTATPATALDISVNAPNTLGPVLTLTNAGGTTSQYGYPFASASIDFKTYLHASTLNSPTSRIEAQDLDYGNALSLQTKVRGADSNQLVEAVNISAGPNNSGAGTYINNYLEVDPYGGDFEGTNLPTLLDVEGNVSILGDVSADSVHASVKDFRIDHPSDPANKYLQHASVESSEMMNIYTGNVTTDELGQATVKLPDWFEAENGDFRYQLTTIGRDAHAWVAEEVANHQFQIATNATFVKVSWQITAVRQDAYAQSHPLVVEQEKPADKHGYYLHPELYGQPMDKQERWAGHPRELAKHKAAMKAATQSDNSSR